MVNMFLNGGGMKGGDLHDRLHGALFVRPARTAAKYRFYSVDDRFPGLERVDEYGVNVVEELDDGTPSLAVLLRQDFKRTARLKDISDVADWRAYRARS